jgi:septal ring-binding cell division protein DamX
MSLTGERPRVDGPDYDALSASDVCAHCGAPLRDDQEWCLQCGAARTLIHRPPDWRIAASVITVVVTLALAAFAIALVNLSSNADQVAGSQTGAKTATAASHPAAPAATTASATTSAGIASWPVGLSGWTVALASSPSQSTANATAKRFAATGLHVGVLDSNQHPSMKPGFWIVFSGRYPGRAEAAAAAINLQSKVSTAPVARRVAPPGGL